MEKWGGRRRRRSRFRGACGEEWGNEEGRGRERDKRKERGKLEEK